LAFAVTFVLLSAGFVIFLWNNAYIPSNPPTLQWAKSNIRPAAWATFPISVIIALLISFIRIARRPGIGVVSFVLMLAAGLASLYFGTIGLSRIAPGHKNIVQRQFTPLSAGSFNQVAGASLFPLRVDGRAIRTLLVVNEEDAAPPDMRLIQNAQFDASGWRVTTAPSGGPVAISPPNPDFTPLYQPPAFLTALFSDVAEMNRAIDRAFGESTELFAIQCAGIVVFVMGCLFFARFTAWPLLNAFFVLASFRGLLWLNTLFANTSATQIAATVVPRRFLPVSPALALAAIGVILILLQILFLRRRRA
jgi:hypothetical protein